jgi:hypothetical protein
MGYAYSALDTASTAPTTPVGWPTRHPFPVHPVAPVWPPGWPLDKGTIYDTTFTFTVTMDDNLDHTEGGSPENQETISLDIFSDSAKGVHASELNQHYMSITCVDSSGATVQLEKTGDGDGMADTAWIEITNYSGNKYGWTDDFSFDLAAADIGDTLTLTFTIVSVGGDQNTTDTILVALAVP